MSLNVTGRGRLINDPKRGRTSAGKPWANAVVRVSVWRKSETGWEEASSYTCTVVGFEDTAVALAAFVKGDEVEIRGRVRELSVWSPATGEPRAQLSVALDEVTAPVKRPRGEQNGDGAGSRPHSAHPRAGASPMQDRRALDREWPRPGRPADAAVAPAPQPEATVLTLPANGVERLQRAHANNPRVRGGRRGQSA